MDMAITITVIDGKRYTVEHVFNMVGNWVFTDKNGTEYLVDGEDLAEWVDEKGVAFDGVFSAIAYATELADMNNGVFWWKEKPATA